MKQLIIKIGNETHELPYNGETFSFEVSEKYVPKVGDCVKIYLKNTKDEYCGKINQIEQKKIWLKPEGIYRNLSLCYDYSYIALTQITPEELKAKYAEAGYDWDYESDTVKPLKWMPKVGDECWVLDSFLQPRIFVCNGRSKYSWICKQIEKGLAFQTEAECKKFSDHCLKYFDKKQL